MFKFWEYDISFKDPASVYAYHMFSTHHDIMWYIIIILILVYWCLYKIITDFSRSGLISSSFFFSMLYFSLILNLNIYRKIMNFFFMCYNELNAFFCYYFYILLCDILYGNWWAIIYVNI